MRNYALEQGFTLLELLIVCVIIGILASMLMVGAEMLGRRAKEVQTREVIVSVRLALEQGSLERGGALAPAEHPLAGSAEPAGVDTGGRPLFHRLGTHDAVAQTGEALKAVDMATVAAASQDRVLLPDDIFVGVSSAGDLPLLYGLRRREIGLVGAGFAEVTRWRDLPAPAGNADRNDDGFVDEPYDGTRYPDPVHLVAPQPEDVDEAVINAVEYALGATGMDRLTAMDQTIQGPFEDASLLLDDRVLVTEGAVQTSRWLAGQVWDAGAGRWTAYRLRGMGIYDAWGREILYSQGRNGSLRLTSAGPDGVFVFHPGDDKTFDTDAYAILPNGDDRDGRKDNVAESAGD